MSHNTRRSAAASGKSTSTKVGMSARRRQSPCEPQGLGLGMVSKAEMTWLTGTHPTLRKGSPPLLFQAARPRVMPAKSVLR
jgi:hypothetical protein